MKTRSMSFGKKDTREMTSRKKPHLHNIYNFDVNKVQSRIDTGRSQRNTKNTNASEHPSMKPVASVPVKSMKKASETKRTLPPRITKEKKQSILTSTASTNVSSKKTKRAAAVGRTLPPRVGKNTQQSVMSAMRSPFSIVSTANVSIEENASALETTITLVRHDQTQGNSHLNPNLTEDSSGATENTDFETIVPTCNSNTAIDQDSIEWEHPDAGGCSTPLSFQTNNSERNNPTVEPNVGVVVEKILKAVKKNYALMKNIENRLKYLEANRVTDETDPELSEMLMLLPCKKANVLRQVDDLLKNNRALKKLLIKRLSATIRNRDIKKSIFMLVDEFLTQSLQKKMCWKINSRSKLIFKNYENIVAVIRKCATKSNFFTNEDVDSAIAEHLRKATKRTKNH